MAQEPQFNYDEWKRRQATTPGTTPAPTIATPPQFMEPVQSTWGRVLDILSRPGQASAAAALALAQNKPFGEVGKDALEAFFKGGDLSYADVLQELGMQPGTANTVLGLVGDVALDPTNWIPGKAFATAARGLQQGMKLTGNLAAKTPVVGGAVESALNSVVPFRQLRNLPEEYQKLAQVRNLESRAARSLAFHQQEDALKPILRAIRDSGQDVTKSMETAMKIADTSIPAAGVTPEVKALVDYIKQFGQDRAKKEISAGLMSAADLKPNYVPKRLAPSEELEFIKSAPRIGQRTFLHKGDFDTFKQGEAAGRKFNYNVIATLGKRQFEGDLAIVQEKFMKTLLDPKASPEIAELFQKAANNIPPTTADGRQFIKFKTKAFTEPTLKKLGEFYVHPDVAKDFDNMLTIPQRAQGLGALFDQTMNTWKSLATVVRPAFVLRNLMSNVYMSLAGGETTVRELAEFYPKAINIIRKGPKYSDPVVDRARQLGITATEFGAIGELGSQAETSIHRMLDPWYSAGELVSVERNLDRARAVSKHVEDTSRLALYLQQLSRGKSPEDAALYVNKWLLNYAEKSPVERQVLSRVFPFATWMTRIVPRIIEGSVRNPQLFSFQDKLKNAIEAGVEDPMPEGSRPEWMQEQNYFQLPSIGPGERRFGSFGLPGVDLNVLPMPFGSSPAATWRELIGRVGPAKALAEIAANVDFQTQSRIGQTSLEELRPAGGTLTLLDKLADQPGIKDVLGSAPVSSLLEFIHAPKLATEGDTTYAPAWANHLAKQLIPVAEQVGKSVQGPPLGQAPEIDKYRLVRNMIFGLPNIQRDTDVSYQRRIEAEKQAMRRRLVDQLMRRQ